MNHVVVVSDLVRVLIGAAGLLIAIYGFAGWAAAALVTVPDRQGARHGLIQLLMGVGMIVAALFA